MTKELYIQNTKIRYLFYLLMSGILVWFLILQAFGTNERDINPICQFTMVRSPGRNPTAVPKRLPFRDDIPYHRRILW